MLSRHKALRLATLFALLVLAVMGIAVAQQNDTAAPGDDFDLDSVISKVTSSKALGFFTKLSLKRDIDRFLENVKKYHDGTGDLTLNELRERYDALVHNLISLVQDKDEELVRSIDEGRDTLWAMLADEKKFATL